jgi:hypothetical protein
MMTWEEIRRLRWPEDREQLLNELRLFQHGSPHYGTGIKNGGYILGQWGVVRRRPWYVRLALWLEGP